LAAFSWGWWLSLMDADFLLCSWCSHWAVRFLWH